MEVKRKKQHYVPQFYLKNFTREDNTFSIYNVINNEIIQKAPYKSQCYENYYYGEDKEWELRLSKLEYESSKIINRIINEESYYPNIKEIEILKKFVIFQRYRTTYNEETIKIIYWETAKSILAMQCYIDKVPITEELLELTKKQFEEKYQQNVPAEGLDMANNLVNRISDLELLVVRYNNLNNFLISSDNPVIFYNNYMNRAVGLENAGLIVILPISPNKIILFFDAKMYQRYKGRKCIQLQNENEVKMLNVFQMLSANKIVYFSNYKQSKQILNDFIKYKKERDLYLKLRVPQTMGVETNKAVIVPVAFIPIKYNFSFSKVHPRGSGYTENEIDWFPRKRNKEYEQRMNLRPQIFSMSNIRKLNRKSIKNIKRLNSFIKDYWNNKL